MIPADHIAFTDDSHAWWVVPGPGTVGAPSNVDADIARMLDRPCKCQRWEWQLDAPPDTHCTDCFNGRHTFELEVEGWFEDGHGGVFPEYTFHRVAIEPGMVLPIVDANKACWEWGVVAVDASGEASLIQRGRMLFFTLPPAARPGMWAVKLMVADQ